MANIGKLNNLSIDDLASLWNIDKADIAKAMGLDVSVITGVLSAGSPTTFHSGTTWYTSVKTMDSTHAIVIYRDDDDGGIGKAVCLELSGTSIIAGSSVAFEWGYTSYISVTTMDPTHAIVTYRDNNDGGRGKAVCLTLSGTSITFESSTTFESGSTYYTSVTTMDETHAIVTYQDSDDGDKGKAVCLTLSGTTITAGSPTTFESGYTSYTSVTTMDETYAIVIYQDSDDKDKAVCLTLSGTSITAGSEEIFESGGAHYTSVTTMDETHAIVIYQDIYDKGKAVCLSLIGTSITAGSPTTFNSGETKYLSVTTMDPTHAIVTYQDSDDNYKGKAVCLTISETSITVGAEETFESGSTYYTSVTTMDKTHAIVTYLGYDDNHNGKGKAVCITLS